MWIKTLPALALLGLASPTWADDAIPTATPMTAEELASHRGGFLLPGGINVALGVTTDTAINGQVVLRTMYNLDEGTPRLTVLGREGGTDLDLAADGTAVRTADGTIRLRTGRDGSVDFRGEAIDVSHLVGQAFGTVVSNSGNDRSIDIVTTVDITLGGATPDTLGSAMPRVETMALDATTRLIR